MKTKLIWLLNFLRIAIFALPLLAFPSDQPGLTITQFEVNELPQFSLYISVTDQTGKPIRLAESTLSPDKGIVKVFEDGQPVVVNEITPVLDLTDSEISRFYIVLVLDNSDSMQKFLKKVKFAADQFIDQVRKQDKISIVVFDPRKKSYHAKLLQSFTNIKHVLKTKTLLTNLTRKTFLYDAIYLAFLKLKEERTIGRKVIVVLSDGNDIGSNYGLKDMIQIAKYSDIPIYAIDFSPKKNRNLKKLAQGTNGRYFRATKADELVKLYEAVLEQLQGQYRITYTTANEDWTTPSRALRVEIQEDNQLLSAERVYQPDVARLQYLALRYKEAVSKTDSKDYLQYLDLYPNSEWCDDVRFKLGVYYEQRGFYDKAQEIYDQLIEQPNTEWRDEVLFRKGKIYENLGEYSKAVETYDKLVSSYPTAKDAPKALIGMARSYREVHSLASAEATYLRIRDEYGGSEVTDEALLELSTIKFQQGKVEEAKELLTELVTNYKESNSTPEAYMSLATISEKEGNLGQAVVYYHKASESADEPEVVSRAFAYKGDLLFNMGDFRGAVEAYETILNQYESHSYKDEALLGLAKSYREEKQYDQMRAYFDKIKQMKANNEEVSFELNSVNSVTAVIPPNSVEKVMTLSGAALETLPNCQLSYPLEVSIKPIPTADQFKSLAIAGSIYDFTASTDTFFTPIKIALPYEEGWLDSSHKRLEDFKLYSYEQSKWRQIPGCYVDSVHQVICAEVTHLSLKTIMFQPPRVIRFEDILFEFNKADLTADSKTKVDSVVSILLSSPKIRLEVQGHTDSVGTYDYNLELSQKRADTIHKYLINAGIDSSRIVANGYGERFPIASNTTEEGRALNRRTEFVIISKGENDIIDVQQRQLGTKYTIQLGSNYKVLSLALEQCEVLKREGYNVTVKHDVENDHSVYKLWCGYFDSRKEAEEFARKITSEFINLKFSIIERE